MSIYRSKLPQLNGRLCITDGGMETDLIFKHGIDLPDSPVLPVSSHGDPATLVSVWTPVAY